MTQEEFVHLSGFDLFRRQLKALREGKLTFEQLRRTSGMWLTGRGYILTNLGWYQPEELTEMGAVQIASGEWVIGIEERRRVTGRGGEQKVEVFHVPERANAFFARLRAANAKFAGLLSASATNGSETGADLVTYARKLFGDEGG
jgi:hypothetical protein